MYNSIQDTVIIGKKVIYLPTCHSTNDIAAEIVHAGLFDEGTVVITDAQVKGRGQRGSNWSTVPGQNLTFSVILKFDFLPLQEQFLISQVVALAIQQYINTYITDAQIKWPNDILANTRKICGVLIENSIQGAAISSSIIGIGVNINQLDFVNDRITSLARETGNAFSVSEEFPKLIRILDRQVGRLKNPAEREIVRADYLQLLYGRKNQFKFRHKDTILNGTVAGVTPQGTLAIDTGGNSLEVGMKEIEWLWD